MTNRCHRYIFIYFRFVSAFACGFNASVSNHTQTITSPNYPNQYFNSLSCRWILTARTGHFVLLTIESFQTEFLHDFVVVSFIFVRVCHKTKQIENATETNRIKCLFLYKILFL